MLQCPKLSESHAAVSHVYTFFDFFISKYKHYLQHNETVKYTDIYYLQDKITYKTLQVVPVYTFIIVKIVILCIITEYNKQH